MNYRLLAFSVDGVVLKENGRLSKSTKEAIEFVGRKGGYVTLVTNRSYQQARKIAKILKLNHEIISYGGAFIARQAERPLHVRRIPVEMARDAVFELEDYSCQLIVEHEKFELTNRQHQPQNLLGKMTVSLGESLFYPQTVVEQLSEHIDLHRISPLRIRASFEDEAEKKAAVEHLRMTIPGMKVHQDHQPAGFHLSFEQTSKADALLYLGHELGIHPEEMVVAGAKPGDEEMLQAAGLGVSMGQAPLEVRKAANWITRSNDQDGLAYMIKEVFRKQMNVSRTFI